MAADVCQPAMVYSLIPILSRVVMVRYLTAGSGEPVETNVMIHQPSHVVIIKPTKVRTGKNVVMPVMILKSSFAHKIKYMMERA
jgi:hypothetical protein